MVTSIASLEMEAYRRLHCYQYLIKPYMRVDVENVVKKLLALQNVKEEKSIVVKKDGINYRIKCNAIVFVKAVPRGICLYLKKEVMKIPYLTIVKLLEQLDKDEFIQCHRMFVVNKKYINIFQNGISNKRIPPTNTKTLNKISDHTVRIFADNRISFGDNGAVKSKFTSHFLKAIPFLLA